MKRTKVKCPICGDVKTTRYAIFRHCSMQHDTASNLFFGDTTKPNDTTIPTTTKQDKDIPEIIPPKTTKHDKETTNPKKQATQNSTETKGVMVTLLDEDTKEVLLSTNAAIVMSPNETLFDAEVDMEVKQPKVKDNPTTNNLPITYLSPESIPTHTNGIMNTLKNPFVTAGIIGIGGYAIKRYIEKKEAKTKENDTNW